MLYQYPNSRFSACENRTSLTKRYRRPRPYTETRMRKEGQRGVPPAGCQRYAPFACPILYTQRRFFRRTEKTGAASERRTPIRFNRYPERIISASPPALERSASIGSAHHQTGHEHRQRLEKGNKHQHNNHHGIKGKARRPPPDKDINNK